MSIAHSVASSKNFLFRITKVLSHSPFLKRKEFVRTENLEFSLFSVLSNSFSEILPGLLSTSLRQYFDESCTDDWFSDRIKTKISSSPSLESLLITIGLFTSGFRRLSLRLID